MKSRKPLNTHTKFNQWYGCEPQSETWNCASEYARPPRERER